MAGLGELWYLPSIWFLPFVWENIANSLYETRLQEVMVVVFVKTTIQSKMIYTVYLQARLLKGIVHSQAADL